jgi:hypothetical protein
MPAVPRDHPAIREPLPQSAAVTVADPFHEKRERPRSRAVFA